MQSIVNSILPVFTLIFLGAILKLIQNLRHPFAVRLCRATGHCDEKWSQVLNKYALYIALPALIINGLANTEKARLISTEIIIITSLILVGFILIIFLLTKLFKLPKELANTYLMGSFFGNIAYIGAPFILSLFPGTAGNISIIIAIHIAVAFSLGIYILEFSKHKHPNFDEIIKGVSTNPLIIAVVFGLLLMFIDNPLPNFINTTLSMLAASASPVVLVAIGMFITGNFYLDKGIIHAFSISALKLIVLPFIFILFANIIGLDGNFDIAILEAGMPVALTNFALAEIYPINKKIMAKTIIISTIASIFSLSLLANFVI